MPWRLDIKIRTRLMIASFGKAGRRSWLWSSAFGVAVIVLAVALVPAFVERESFSDRFVAEVQAAQARELSAAKNDIYHIVRVIEEGGDKADFVRSVMGSDVIAAPRTDIVETWQHNETALAIIQSNMTERSYEVYLSVDADQTNDLELYHYGSKDPKTPEPGRALYDEAHDLASLYADYQSLEAPTVPVVPLGARLVKLSRRTGVAEFVHQPSSEIEVHYLVDIDSKLVTEEIIYVRTANNPRPFEMTRVLYSNRNIIPAASFEEIFRTDSFDYEKISIQTKSPLLGFL